MKELTKAEEQVMQILWDIEKGFVKEILVKMEDPRPAYNTVSTIVRILEKKGFVGYTAYGKSHQYYPLITQETYSREYLDTFVGNYFGGSFSKLVSFFAKEKNLSVNDMDELMKHVKNDMGNDKPSEK
ncbi:BlaI/MecI/CopY family transcriptional regulator [Roseivirga sp. BDSF3-8]|uniref:BlaI/MecI/CopY family transcriptional regulator n=1 Tax=Roseivirga sp. BDSF3-8 TaxID=3241598 RepID=UPI003531DD8B